MAGGYGGESHHFRPGYPALGDTVSVTDGKDNVLGDLFKKETKTKGYGKTAKAAMWSILAVPPGMNMYPEKGPYPYDSLHMYQLVKKNVQGTYTAAVMVFSGTEDDFFHEGRKRDALFWRDAFREDAGRPTSLFGMPKISTAEFQSFLDMVLKENGGTAGPLKSSPLLPGMPSKTTTALTTGPRRQRSS